jgi:lipopolysaccharide export system permease protein
MKFSLLDRYIAATMLKATAVTVVVLVALMVFFGLIDELDNVGRGNFGLGDAFLVVILSTPRYVFEVFPVAAMLGSLIGLGAMGSHGELVAMRSAGFSLRQITLAVMKTGVLMMLFVFLFGELVAPASEQWGEQHRIEELEMKTTLKTRHGFWARDGSAFVNIREVLPRAQLREIYVYEFDDARRLTLATRAERAEHRGDHWVMFGIRQSRISEDGVSERQLARARWDSLLDPGLLRAVLIHPTMLPLNELHRYIRLMRDNGQSAIDYEVAFWSKLATPPATLVMLFLSVPFVLAHSRFVSIGQRIFLGIVFGMAFYMLNRGMSYVALVYGLNPVVSALIPAAAFLAIAVFMIRRVR